MVEKQWMRMKREDVSGWRIALPPRPDEDDIAFATALAAEGDDAALQAINGIVQSTRAAEQSHQRNGVVIYGLLAVIVASWVLAAFRVINWFLIGPGVLFLLWRLWKHHLDD
jgi:hypothetical protein